MHRRNGGAPSDLSLSVVFLREKKHTHTTNGAMITVHTRPTYLIILQTCCTSAHTPSDHIACAATRTARPCWRTAFCRAATATLNISSAAWVYFYPHTLQTEVYYLPLGNLTHTPLSKATRDTRCLCCCMAKWWHYGSERNGPSHTHTPLPLHLFVDHRCGVPRCSNAVCGYGTAQRRRTPLLRAMTRRWAGGKRHSGAVRDAKHCGKPVLRCAVPLLQTRFAVRTF